jgi:RNA polymerase-binding protein DksA
MSIDNGRFRAILLEERDRVEHAIAKMRENHPGTLDDEVEEISGTSDNHLFETATATLDREIDYTLEENSAQVLTEIHDALAKIDNGTYGTCGCGKEIGEARLEAYPWAIFCIECARKAERA